MKLLDIVIPIYNSADITPKLIDRLNEWRSSIDFDFHVIFVDDGSLSNIKKEIDKSKKDFSYRLVRLSRNYGQHSATAIGLGYCDAPYIATIDDDLQHDPFDIPKLIKQLEKDQVDLVFGTFTNKNHSFARNLGSKILKWLFKFEGVDYSTVTSFRLMKLKVASSFKNKRRPVVFIEEYLIRNSNGISSTSVTHHKRELQGSSYSYWRLFKFALKIILYHSSLPLNFIVRFGILTSIVCFLFGCYFIYQKVVFDSQVGYSSTIVSIFFSSGLILMTLGIIGEYIRRIWISQNELDQVSIYED
jgi:undecaprenyl-phosphate 4-deoxy-4-formamido-L-arabinose transferase